MSNPIDPRHQRFPAKLATRLSAVSVAALIATLFAAILLVFATASAQSIRSTATTNPATLTRLDGDPDLQGLWDFTMRVGERTSPGFFAIGPLEDGWAGSLTLYLTNTLAIRVLTVKGDSVRMVVASREGDVVFHGRLTDNGGRMEGVVDYHGGERYPMTATRRAQLVVAR